jgi:hypothetical protein
MWYHASWRYSKGWWVLSLVVSLVLLVVGAIDHAYGLILLGIVPAVYLYAIGRRLSVEIDEQGIRYHGWLTAKRADWKDVTAVASARFPYPRDRYYGPLCFEVRTATCSFVINLLYFPPEFRRRFSEEVQRRGLRRKRRRTL